MLNRLIDAEHAAAIFRALTFDWDLPNRYLHWDELRHREPPKGLKVEEWWLRIRLSRNGRMQSVPLEDVGGKAFEFWLPGFIQQRLHEIDFGGGGFVSMPLRGMEPEMRDRYIIKSLINEAITSSQLEGAATTRQVAKEMLQSGRKPRDRHERMIVNNFQTMQRIMEIREETMTPGLVCELHRLVTEGTLDKPDKAGRLRVASDNVQVTTPDESTVLHDPPVAGELKHRMKVMCDFANGRIPSHYISPAVRAILLHFWLAFDHPFVDGNGRTARALFYWSMLHQGYWMFEFISISEIILRAPVQYARSFLYAESDSNDLTYFLDHQLKVIMQAMKNLHQYIERKNRESREAAVHLRQLGRYNSRQVALLLHALMHPLQIYTLKSHQTCHVVTPQTSRNDLEELHHHRLLDKGKQGRAFTYTPASTLGEILKTKKR